MLDKPLLQKPVYTPADIYALGIAKETKFYELIKSGALPAKKLGRKTVILAADLQRYLDTLPSWQPRRG